MLKQIFRKNVPTKIVYELLDRICLKTEKYYVIDVNSYRKMKFHNYEVQFLADILEFYHSSKSFYVNRKLTYNSFTNIIRQICKSNEIIFTSQIKYNDSKYNIDYFVYFIQNTNELEDLHH